MSEFVFYGDLYFECVNTSPRFGFMDEFASPNGRRYTCMETVTFLVDDGMSPEQRSTQTIPFLAISTDSDWKNTPDENCYRRIETIRTPTPTLSPTKVPISTTTPVFLSAKLPLSLSETPVQPPASKILNAPVKTSSIRSETSTARQNDHLTSASNSIERSAILAAIAGMVSGVAIAGILVYLVVRRKKITQQTRLGSLDAEVTRGQSPIHEFTKSTSSGQLQGISGIDDTCASAIDHKVIHDSDIETADSSIREMVHTETDSTQSDESFHSHQTKELFQTSDTIPSPISNEASQSTDLQDRDINEVRRSSECGLKLMDDTQVDDHVDHLLKENDAGETSSPSMSTLSPPRREDPLLEEKNFQDLTRTVASEDQSNREADQVLDMSSLPPEASIETQSGFVEKIEETLIGTVPRVTTIPSHETDLLSHALSANVELLNSLITLEGCSCESTIEAQSPTVELPTHGDLIATDSAVNAMPSSSENDLS